MASGPESGGEVFESEQAVVPGVDGGTGDLGVEARKQLFEHDRDLEPGEVSAQAVVRSVAEAQVTDRAAVNVEVIGTLELALVPVGGLQQQKDPLTGRDPRTAHDDLAERGAPHGLKHALVTDQLLESAGDEYRVASEVLALVRRAAQLERAARQNLGQRLGRPDQ